MSRQPEWRCVRRPGNDRQRDAQSVLQSAGRVGPAREGAPWNGARASLWLCVLGGPERPNRPSEAAQAQRAAGDWTAVQPLDDRHWTGRGFSRSRLQNTTPPHLLSLAASTHVHAKPGLIAYPRAPRAPPPPPTPAPERATHAGAPWKRPTHRSAWQITRADSPGSATGSRGC